MAKHYRKKHPAAMKRKVRHGVAIKGTPNMNKGKFCPHCGGFLG